MLVDQSLPRYRNQQSLLNELGVMIAELESRSAVANKLLFENKLTEPQKIAYDKLTKELAVLKNLSDINIRLMINYEILMKLDPDIDSDWKEKFKEYKQSIEI